MKKVKAGAIWDYETDTWYEPKSSVYRNRNKIKQRDIEKKIKLKKRRK